MNIPQGMTESEVLDTIEKISHSLAGKFKFGYHSYDDMKQYAFMYGIDGLNSYDPAKGQLENFLRSHIRNRLFNLKRDNYQRPDKPCYNCPLKAYDPNCSQSYSGCLEYSDKSECELYRNWENRNARKKNVLTPIGMDNVQDENESNMKRETDIGDEIDQRAIFEIIETHLTIDQRENWLRLKNGAKLPKSKKEKLISHIRSILENEGINVSQAW